MHSSDSTREIPMLYISVDPSYPELIDIYENAVQQHNDSVLNDIHPNAGFDIFFPESVEFNCSDSLTQTKRSKCLVNFRIKCEMHLHNRASGFYLYPRSSISKTDLMLANQTGIIDSGYRGYILGAFRYLGEKGSVERVEKGSRLLQICSPNLEPFLVKLVDESFLSDSTRGAGGFGSTGV